MTEIELRPGQSVELEELGLTLTCTGIRYHSEGFRPTEPVVEIAVASTQTPTDAPDPGSAEKPRGEDPPVAEIPVHVPGFRPEFPKR